MAVLNSVLYHFGDLGGGRGERGAGGGGGGGSYRGIRKMLNKIWTFICVQICPVEEDYLVGLFRYIEQMNLIPILCHLILGKKNPSALSY